MFFPHENNEWTWDSVKVSMSKDTFPFLCMCVHCGKLLLFVFLFVSCTCVCVFVQTPGEHGQISHLFEGQDLISPLVTGWTDSL